MIFRLNFRYRSKIQRSEVSNAGIKKTRLRSIQNLAIQKDGRGENRYCTPDERKKGTGKPSINSPDSFAIAMPSTRLWEKVNSKSATATLVRLVSRQVRNTIQTGQTVRENQCISAVDITIAITAGNASLDKI